MGGMGLITGREVIRACKTVCPKGTEMFARALRTRGLPWGQDEWELSTIRRGFGKAAV